MNTRKIVLAVVVLLLVALAAYWLGAQSDADEVAAPAPPPEPAASVSVVGVNTGFVSAMGDHGRRRGARVNLADDGSAPVPVRYQFAQVDHVQAGLDFEGWMAQYSEADQVLIRAFNEQHFGLYEGRTPAAIAWMAANGYPMPEDIIAAQGINTEQLEQMAIGGNDKAAFLLKDRYLSHLAQLMNGQGMTFEDAARQLRYMDIDPIKLSGGIYQSASPYKAYLTARTAAVKGSNTDEAFEDAMVLAALSWAKNLGDLRADDLILDYVQSDPDQQMIRSLLQIAMIASTNMTLMQRETSGFNCGAPAIPYPQPASNQ